MKPAARLPRTRIPGPSKRSDDPGAQPGTLDGDRDRAPDCRGRYSVMRVAARLRGEDAGRQVRTEGEHRASLQLGSDMSACPPAIAAACPVPAEPRSGAASAAPAQNPSFGPDSSPAPSAMAVPLDRPGPMPMGRVGTPKPARLRSLAEGPSLSIEMSSERRVPMPERWRSWLEIAKVDAAAFRAGRNGRDAGEATTKLAERVWEDISSVRGHDPKRELSGFAAMLSGCSVESLERESDYYSFVAAIVRGYADLMPTR
jgi:hypothetical protein